MDARYAFELDPAISLPLNSYVAPNSLTALQKLSLLEVLQEEISVTAMLTNFATEAAKFIPLSGIRFNSGSQNHRVDLKKQQAHYHSFTLFDHKKLIGKISYTSAKKLSPNEYELIRELNQILARPLNLALSFFRLEQRVKQDHLTGLGNRALFDEALHRAVEQNSRHETGLVLMLMDLNKFKQVNDTYGHKAGDRVLTAFAQILTKVIRNSDLAFRFGGDEFALLLQPAQAQAAQEVSRRVQQGIELHPVMINYQVGSAIGFANWEHGQSAETLFELADQRLYANKNNTL